MIKATDIIFKLRITLLSVIFIVCFLSPVFVGAQTSSQQFLTSWQVSNSYAPSWYRGKVFPTTGSRVSVKFDFIDNGKVADLSKNKIRWYINDNLVINEVNGLGIKNYSFIDNDYVGSDTEVRISIPDYKTGSLNYVLTIPVVNPEIIIKAPYGGKKISVGKAIFEAIPFFFKISNQNRLNFRWTANNQSTGDSSSQFLNLNIDPATTKGSMFDIAVFAKNISNELEQASKNMQMIIQ